MPYKFAYKRTARRKAKRRLPPGPLKKPGGYTLAGEEDALLSKHPEVLTYLRIIRKGLVQDLSPEGELHLTMARRLLLDRAVQKLGWSRIVELYISKTGLVRRDALEKGVLEAAPILQFWMGLGNSLRRDLELLGLDRKAMEAEVLTAEALMLEVAKEAKEAEVVEEPSEVLGEGEVEGHGNI